MGYYPSLDRQLLLHMTAPKQREEEEAQESLAGIFLLIPLTVLDLFTFQENSNDQELIAWAKQRVGRS